MQHIAGIDRHQIQMFSLDQLVGKESMARIIDAFVNMLDMKTFGFAYYNLNAEGRPPYHPRLMMKIYLYGYHHSIRSSRKLAQGCKVNVEMMWLTNGLTPNFKTIANFRKDNAKAFKEVFRYFVAILKDWELISGHTIGIDSFKTRAQNSLKNNFNQRKIQRHLQHIDQKIEEYCEQLDEENQENIKRKIQHNKKKKKQYQALQQELKDTGEAQISTTDKDSRAVVFQRNSVKVGYNIQAASDSEHKLLIAADTGDVNDTKALAVMVKKAQENIGQVENVLADKGYNSGRELKACEALGVNTYVSPKEHSSSNKNGYAMKDFIYNQGQDTYTCPAGQVLKTNGRWYNKKLDASAKKSYQVKHYKTKACLQCKVKDLCTKSTRGRYIERSEYHEYVERNNQRVQANPNYYRQRQQIIEHQFGTLKRHRHFDYLLTRGKQKVLGEVYLAFTTYNLGRTISILGFSELLRRLKACFSNILTILTITFAPQPHSIKKYSATHNHHSQSYG